MCSDLLRLLLEEESISSALDLILMSRLQLMFHHFYTIIANKTTILWEIYELLNSHCDTVNFKYHIKLSTFSLNPHPPKKKTPPSPKMQSALPVTVCIGMNEFNRWKDLSWWNEIFSLSTTSHKIFSILYKPCQWHISSSLQEGN